MNAYGIDIWRGVEHNGKFVTNANRFEVIHARNEQEAKSKITLAKGYTQELPALTIKVSAECIYSVTKLGTVKIEPYYVYSGDKSPISVEDFKRRQNG